MSKHVTKASGPKPTKHADNQRAVIIGRVSTDIQRDNYSIGTQVRAAIEYVEDHGYTLVGHHWVNPDTGYDAEPGVGVPAYVDDYTSRELSRPALDSALEYLETPGYDVAVVHALDRLARDPYIRRTLEMEFERRGARVEYVLGSYDDTPEGEVKKDLDATFAKWENAKRVERCLRGKRGKAEQGLFVAGTVPYGYAPNEAAPGGLAIEPDQAGIVARIFDLYVSQRESIRAIAATLSREGAVNASGSTEWGKSTIARILANETYAGINYYNKWQRRGRRLTLRPSSEWVPIKVTPIVSRDLFEVVQGRLADNRAALRRKPQRFYLLSGMVRCTQCERPYAAGAQRAGKNRRVVDALHYRHRQKEQHACHNRYVSARVLEPDVWRTLVAAVRDADKLRRGYAESIERQQAEQGKALAHIEQLERGKSKWERALDNLNAAYVDPDIPMSKAEYMRQKAAIDANLADVTEKVTKAQAELAHVPTAASLEAFDRFAAAIRRRLDANREPTPVQKRQLLEMLHVTVWIDPAGNHTVDGWFSEQKDKGLLSKVLRHYGRRPRPPRGRA